MRLNTRATAETLLAGGFDEIILATGIVPRTPEIPGIDHPKVIGYLDAILERKPVGQRVAVIGAGGIGFDVSEYITHDGQSTSLDREAFWKEWGIDLGLSARGGIAGIQPAPHAPKRQVYLLQRKKSKVGNGLGKTTGWIHRTGLKNKHVQMLNSVSICRSTMPGCTSGLARASRRCWRWIRSFSAPVRSRYASFSKGWKRLAPGCT